MRMSDRWVGELLFSRIASAGVTPSSGTQAYGVHINGFVETDEGLELWVARRSRDKPTWPGKLDHIVAGGLVRQGQGSRHGHGHGQSQGPFLRTVRSDLKLPSNEPRPPTGPRLFTPQSWLLCC